MVVDPTIDQVNPEVCDPCDLNCGPLNRDYFDASYKYLGTTQMLPPGFAFAFYICAVVKPVGVANCPAAPVDSTTHRLPPSISRVS